jgi:DNA-directed RNA polymerase subunit K/omega
MQATTEETVTSANYYNSNVGENTTNILHDNTYHNHFDILKNYNEIKKNNRTRPRITKYELTKCLGMRAEMLARGAPALVDVPEYIDSVEDIAKMEHKQGKLPFILRRKITGGYDYWKLEDLS